MVAAEHTDLRYVVHSEVLCSKPFKYACAVTQRGQTVVWFFSFLSSHNELVNSNGAAKVVRMRSVASVRIREVV